MSQTVQPQSSSLQHPDYWWYRARTELLGTVLGPYVGSPRRTLDVGSADAPSVEWMRGPHQRVTLDLHPEGLVPGEGVCGSAMALPFADESFDVVAAFDVVEHCEDDALALSELARVLAPGGRMLLSVPAYQWAWSDHDVESGHHRRYTRKRFTRLVESAGLGVTRSTYVFGGVFPFFVAERAMRRMRRSRPADTQADASADRLPQVSPTAERVLMSLSRLDRRLLRSHDLPFGSSVVVAAAKPPA